MISFDEDSMLAGSLKDLNNKHMEILHLKIDVMGNN